MTEPIVVINPNSSEKITRQIREAVPGDDIAVKTSHAGPPAIESDADVIAAIEPMLAVASSHDASAYIVACFSDPGLDELRARGAAPAFGIAEAAIRLAKEAGSKIGVISSVAASIPRHERYWEKLGVADLIVADVPLGLGVLELDTPRAEALAQQAGQRLVESGADVIVLGCTGMTHMAATLGEQLGVPVVDPCRAAVQLARRTLGQSE